MPKVECQALTCKHNEKISKKYGICKNDTVILKFRLAGDFGKGAIIFLECLNMELIEDEEEHD